MFYARLMLFLIFLLPACAFTPPKKPPPGDAAVVFIPGFYGTALADSEGNRVFLTLGQALWGDTPLALAEPDLGVTGARSLRPDGILHSVSVVPWFYSIDAYGAGTEFLERSFSSRALVVSLPYDWRQDIHDAVKALDALVKSLHAQGRTRIALVSHSMGGMITAYYLRYGAQAPELAVENWEGARQVHLAVLAGVPFGGAVQSFHNLLYGTSLGTAQLPLNALSLSTFPSMYQLLPAPDTAAVVNAQMKPMGNPLHDFTYWKKWGWGMLQFPADDALRAKRESVTRLYLRRATAFSNKLRAPTVRAPAHRLPVLVVQGTQRSTASRAQWKADRIDAAGGWAFNTETLGADGDGVVTFDSSRLPDGMARGFQSTLAILEVEHTQMLSHWRSQERLSGYLQENGF